MRCLLSVKYLPVVVNCKDWPGSHIIPGFPLTRMEQSLRAIDVGVHIRSILSLNIIGIFPPE